MTARSRSDALTTEHYQALITKAVEAPGSAFGALHIIAETTDDEQTSKVASEARDELDSALSALRDELPG